MKLYYLCPNTMENSRKRSLKINLGVFQHPYRKCRIWDKKMCGWLDRVFFKRGPLDRSVSTEGTHAPLASELSYKVTSSLRHSDIVCFHIHWNVLQLVSFHSFFLLF